MRLLTLLVVATTVSIIAGCSSTGSRSGKYYEDDGPPGLFSSLRMEVENATPRVDKPIPATNRPYTVMGKRYYPVTGDKAMVQTGYGSWYGKKFHGKKTSSGEVYDMYKMTAAHKTMELPSYARVTNLENGRSVIVRVNDRGPFLHNRIIDLSYAAATKLGYASKGTARLKVERITRAQIASGDWDNSSYSGKAVLAAALSSTLKKQLSQSDIAKASVETVEPAEAPREMTEQTVKQLAQEGVEPQPIASAEVVSIKEDAVEPTTRNPEVRYIEEGVFVMADGSSAVGKVETTVHVPEAGEFAVQLGAFKSKANAEHLLQKYSSVQRENALPQGKIIATNGVFKVLVGGKSQRESAKSLADQLKILLGQSAIVVKDAN